MKLKWIYFLIGLSIVSCDNSNNTENTLVSENNIEEVGLHIDSILKRGKLIAIINNDPTSYFIYKGRPMGYQYELLSRFCKELGVKLEVIKVASIPDAFDSLKQHKADIIASGITVLGDRKKNFDFSYPITQTRQVLIQKKPEGYKKWSKSKLEKHLLRDLTKLANQTVFVELGSSYYERIISLQNEIGDSIHIITYDGEIDVDSMMTLISQNQFKYAVSDEYTAKFFVRYFPNVDMKTPVSFNQNIAWALPKNSNTLTDTLNHWIQKNKNSTFWNMTYNKYFKNTESMNTRIQSNYNLKNGKISPYDVIIKNESEKIGWDWKLVAAQIRVESGFQPNKTSWAGAQGLMQIMPLTANSLNPNHTDIFNPKENIKMGVKLNGILFHYWTSVIPDSSQAIKFSLASYNVGKGHVFDAQRLAKKYGKDPTIWDQNVEDMIVKLSKSKYYKDPEVYYGYCRGLEAYNYVSRITALYGNYNNFETIIK
ncbi:MAG: membrane-bound lytic murein transglycosylase F [Salibacteraceae bacterium]|jgi:membrane-bound lytic murein transglycosylase F